MKYRTLHLNDLHFAKQNPTSRKDDYNGELFELLDQVYQIAALLKVNAVCIAGDIFHNKGVVPWDVLIKLLEWGQRVQSVAALVTISGNHDQTHDRYESIEQTPYGALISSGLFTDISRRMFPLGQEGPVLYGVPWPDGAKPDAFVNLPPEVDIVLAHGFATAEGTERWGVHCHRYEHLAAVAPRVRVWHFGHDHTDHGVFQLPNGAQVINVGAVARGALDQDTLLRQVKVALVEYDPQHDTRAKITQVALKQRPVDDIFDLDRHKARVEERHQLDTFLDDLQQGLSGVLDVDYLTVLNAMPLDDTVRERVRQYIEKAEAVA